ncbi:aminotransferase class V-fold PLP-dependent enzyme [Spongiimicrobium salis]|uniref:aminotransferase class V-fold PLP-dependent enzyme n=1 Tax=Spongiimicrobium salis TaxID=1667022 RepID=UPI00374DC5FA
MKNNHRRKFIRSLTSGIAGSMIMPTFAAATTDAPIISAIEGDIPLDAEEAYWEAIAQQFVFAPKLRYFNNASLGGSPIPVQQASEQFRATLDGFPSKYMWGGWADDKEEVREKLARIFTVSAEEIALVHNTTEGMNLIARSFDLKAGDEVILADHEHASGTIPWEYWQETKGVKLIRPTLPILPESVEEVVEVYKKAITPRTKVISMCHIVNTNGMILPVKEVSEIAHEKGILVAVDGAQSAGMFTIDLHDLGCDFYVASSHKWLFSPKGLGVFYAKKEQQHHLKPLMVARGYKDSSIRRLENYNTRNLSEVLGLGAAADFHNQIGKNRIHERSYALKKYFRSKIDANPKLQLKTPALDALSAAIQVVEVKGKEVSIIKKQLGDTYGIDCRPMNVFGLNALRFSLAVYITKKDIDYLVRALEELA